MMPAGAPHSLRAVQAPDQRAVDKHVHEHLRTPLLVSERVPGARTGHTRVCSCSARGVLQHSNACVRWR